MQFSPAIVRGFVCLTVCLWPVGAILPRSFRVCSGEDGDFDSVIAGFHAEGQIPGSRYSKNSDDLLISTATAAIQQLKTFLNI